MQNKPVNKHTLLISLRAFVISLEGVVKELKITANKKKIVNKGNPNLEDLFLKNQADPITKGTIHKVLVTLSVAATSIASFPIIDAAPKTEAVS